jgi:hypothetical protein
MRHRITRRFHFRRGRQFALNQLRHVCFLVVASFADENQIVKESYFDVVLVEIIRFMPFDGIFNIVKAVRQGLQWTYDKEDQAELGKSYQDLIVSIPSL